MKKTINNCIYILFCLCTFYKNHAQNNNNYYVEKRLYTYKDGLSGRIVKNVTQDNNGYIWIVTNNGLCRFDGKKFISFTQKSHGLYSNNINTIVSDHNNAIIISYFNDKTNFTYEPGHIDVIDINTFKIKKLKEHYVNVPFKDSDVFEVRSDPDDTQHVYFTLKPLTNLQNMVYITSNVILLNKNGQFIKQTIKPTKTIKFINNGSSIQAILEPYYTGINMMDKAFVVLNDSTIISTKANLGSVNYKDDKGGFLLDYEKDKIRKFYYLKNFSNLKEISKTDTSFPYFTFINRMRYYYNRLNLSGLVFNNNNSIFLFQKNKDLIPLLDSTDKEEFKKAKVQSVFKDNIGNYWLSTSEGLLKITITKNNFHLLFTNKQIPFGLNNSTRGFYKYKDTLLVATSDFIGIKKPHETKLIKSNNNFGFCESSNKLWSSSSNIQTVNIQTEKIENKNAKLFGEVWAIFPFKTNQLLLGCTEKPCIYNTESNTVTNINVGNYSSPNITYRFLKDSQNILIVANNGIYTLNNQGKIIDCFNKFQKEKNKKLLVEDINDLHIDKDGLYWIATAFNGLYCWDRKGNTIEYFGVDNGFLSLTHYRIEEDAFNNLWISTEFGLAKFNKNTKQVKIYTEKDGIPHNEFNRTSSFKDIDGTLYFGGLNGVTYFNPKDFIENEGNLNYPFLVNNISVYNSDTYLIQDETNNYFKEKNITLTENKKNISIQVLLVDLEDRTHLYAYQIAGLEKDWNYTNEGIIKLNNLPYGKYTIKIKAQCVNGSWNKTELFINLNVPKPFYKTWLFIIIIIAIIAITIFLIIKQRIKSLQKQNQKLEHIVDVRTFELRESLAEQIALLQEVHHRVKNNLQFTAAMLEMQLDTIIDKENYEILKETSRRINAISLVHEMLYNKEKLEYVSVKEYLFELIDKLKELIYDTEEKIKFETEIDDVKFNITNCVAIGMITSEIISNTIKYAFNESTNPLITIKLSVNNDQKSLLYSIADNGKGMPETIEKKGLGLRLIDIFSRQMGASYEMKNNNGLLYTFKIPYTLNEN